MIGKLLKNVQIEKAKMGTQRKIRKTLVSLIMLASIPYASANLQEPTIKSEKNSANVSSLSQNGSDIMASSSDYINKFTGQAAFGVTLGGITNHGISYNLNLSYSGSEASRVNMASQKFAQTTWVGLGFTFDAPRISVHQNGSNAVGHAALAEQEYSISLDGNSEEDLIQIPNLNNDFVVKTQPEIHVKRVIANSLSRLSSFCPGVGGLFNFEVVDYWIVTFPSGQEMIFGEQNQAWGDESNYELYEPIVGGENRYTPFYGLGSSVAPAIFYAQKIVDENKKFAIWFEYKKIQELITLPLLPCGASNLPHLPTRNKLDRWIYLSEVFSTNGITKSDFKTNQILLYTADRKEEKVFDPTAEYVERVLKNQKLDKIEIKKNNIKVSELKFEYESTVNQRMRLSRIMRSEPKFGTSKPVKSFSYGVNGDGKANAVKDFSWRLYRVTDWKGEVIEYEYGKQEIDPFIANPTNTYQDLSSLLPDVLPGKKFYPGDRIAFASQVGKNYYVEIENASEGCPTSQPIGKWTERLYEFEPHGTFWKLKRIIPSPVSVCPLGMDFNISPNGKYFLWTYPVSLVGGTGIKIQVYDLVTEGVAPNLLAEFQNGFNYWHQSERKVEITLFDEWFVVGGDIFKRHLSFYTKNMEGNWIEPNLESSMPEASFRKDAGNEGVNYSGEDENITISSNTLTFEAPYSTEIIRGPDYILVHSKPAEIIHLFSYTFPVNNSAPNLSKSINHFINGLDKSTAPLPNFQCNGPTQNCTNTAICLASRPLYRENSNHHNNWTRPIKHISVSENIIATISESSDPLWKYLYVFSWDGIQFRFLYDEIIRSADLPDQLEVVAGPSYFVLKNHYQSVQEMPPSIEGRGFYYYKLDLKNWNVRKEKIGNPTDYFKLDPQGETERDWSITAGRNILSLERMAEGFGYQAKGPAIVGLSSIKLPDGTLLSVSRFYNHYNFTHRVSFDQNRDLKHPFPNGEEYDGSRWGNCAELGNRLLCVWTQVSGDPYPGKSHLYYVFRKDAIGDGYSRVQEINLTKPSDLDKFFSATLVNEGVMATAITKNFADPPELAGLFFYPDMQSFGDKDPVTHINTTATTDVITSISLLENGQGSSGNGIQKTIYSYPKISPEGLTAERLWNFSSGLPNFKYVKEEVGPSAKFTEFNRNEISNQASPENEILNGSVVKTWFLPDKVTWKKPGGSIESKIEISKSATDCPTNILCTPKSFLIQNVQQFGQSFFFNSYTNKLINFSDFDLRNGTSKVAVEKIGSDYIVNLTLFQHDLNPNEIRSGIVRQTATFKFNSDPCTRINITNPCNNLNLNYFKGNPENMKKIVASSIFVQDGDGLLKTTFVWVPGTLGTDYPNLDGIPISGSGQVWQQQIDILNRQSGNNFGRCKSDEPTEVEQMGVYTSNYFGGVNCNLIGSVANSKLSTSALLTGEEEILPEFCADGTNTCLGAFGRWEKSNAILQDSIVHTGRFALKIGASTGPSIKLRLGEGAEYLNRKKGLILSAWIYAASGSDPSFMAKFFKAGEELPINSINLVSDYITKKGSLPLNKWVKVERMVTYAELTAQEMFSNPASGDYLQIGLSNGTSSSIKPVYVDDIRIYPADAQVTTQNYDETGLLTSMLDVQNEPVFFEYDVWGNRTGARNKYGMIMSSTSEKQLNE